MIKRFIKNNLLQWRKKRELVFKDEEIKKEKYALANQKKVADENACASEVKGIEILFHR